MSTPQTPTTSAPATTGSAAPSASTASQGTVDRINAGAGTSFGMPSGIKLDQFDGSDWANWSGIMEAILTLHEAEDLLQYNTAPINVPNTDWDSLQRRTKAYLRLYIKPDVYSLIASNTDLPSFKDKWDKLRNTYGGASGSTTAFNLWRQLTQANLDDSAPMAQQLAKINEIRVGLTNA